MNCLMVLLPDFIQAQQASAALRANLDDEGAAVTAFLAAFHSDVSRPLQHARCLVESAPWAPQVMAMANVLGECEGVACHTRAVSDRRPTACWMAEACRCMPDAMTLSNAAVACAV